MMTTFAFGFSTFSSTSISASASRRGCGDVDRPLDIAVVQSNLSRLRFPSVWRPPPPPAGNQTQPNTRPQQTTPHEKERTSAYDSPLFATTPYCADTVHTIYLRTVTALIFLPIYLFYLLLQHQHHHYETYLRLQFLPGRRFPKHSAYANTLVTTNGHDTGGASLLCCHDLHD